MDAKQIAALLLRNRYGRVMVVPNYTPFNWFEADVFELTDAGYFREYEIKVSRGDFFADAEKQMDVREGWRRTGAVERKHELLAAKSPRGPAQFWYVVPFGMVRLNEVPAFAGLIECKIPPGSTWPVECETKKAPRLHNCLPDPKVEKHVRSVCYYRMHVALGRMERLRQVCRRQQEELRRMKNKTAA